MLILNLKTYEQTELKQIHRLLDPIDFFIGEDPKFKDLVFVAPPVQHLTFLKQKYTNINFISQYVDNKEPGQSTGWLTPESLVDIGIEYALFNHSEHRVWGKNIFQNIDEIQNREKKVNLMVCTENIEEAKFVANTNPFAICYEPPELIGTGNSVSDRPEVVENFVRVVEKFSIPMIGAGVSTGSDIEKCIQLGAKGVLVASAFVKAENHEQKFIELLTPFMN